MNNITQRFFNRCLAATAAAVLGLFGVAAQAAPANPETLIRQNCVGCHQPEGENSWSRISHQRKTPEGWLMTIARMQSAHGLRISDEDRRTLVKYLADRQGMAPEETADVRYALERRLNDYEPLKDDEHIGDMCARCHSGARVVMQGRDEKEWEHLIHTHLGLWASLEYQALSRDRDWLPIALNETLPHLAQRLPFQTAAWDQWMKARPAADQFNGRWSFAGHYTGAGDISGTMTVEHTGNDLFRVVVDGRYDNGRAFRGEGQGILYNGHEWRANVTIDDVVMRQVLVATPEGMTGRMFERDRDERGLDFAAARDNQRTLLAVFPEYIKAGAEQELTIVGAGMNGRPNLGRHIRVLDVIEQTPERVRVRVRADDKVAIGPRDIKVGRASGASVAVYRDIQSVRVVPEYAVARIGGNGSPTEKVEGRFDAEAWAVAADGSEFRVGVMPATWSVAPFDEAAAKLEDVKFAGRLNAQTGVFDPAVAGPNPERPMMANNVGNLSITARVKDGEREVSGDGQLIVSVQRWVIPPIP
ncbi:quinohemoprotein amine dehydrogenase subunit alpha [Isoalcanivorax beigongshangi]|uniref:Quinohemoprotein amine dehydrogenase subunit alpha n=1 Tax=Isoalcanivorax beigongshangi TaxID=3238810 RepID=A0ABV4AJC7_9GAMM